MTSVDQSPLLAQFVDLHSQEAAGIVAAADLDEAADFLRTSGYAADLLDRMNAVEAAAILARMPDDDVPPIVAAMDPGRSASTLAQIEPVERERILSRLEARIADELRDLLTYPPESAGRLMQSRFPRFDANETVNGVLDRLRRSGQEVQQLVVVTGDDGLKGVVPIGRAAVAQPGTTVGELVQGAPAHVMNMASREEVLDILSTHKVSILPVVDADFRVVGIIDQASLMRAAREEAASDIQSMVGVSREERALSPALFAVRRRLPWLNINLLTAFLAASVVGIFESTIAQFTALAVLLPVVAGQSGNTGAQALAVVMRGLALREIRSRHASRVLVKEGVAGLLNGVAIALVTCIGVYIWSGSAGLCLVIGMAMVISMFLAGLSGAAIPLILSAMRQDPAQSGSIFLTTVTDVVGFFSFLGLATVFSGLL
ncbi:MAG: magnesium transporter [Gammaproteobacteria bacterium]|nr:magnesium transporter [Gammaproteobacteria bacterium]